MTATWRGYEPSGPQDCNMGGYEPSGPQEQFRDRGVETRCLEVLARKGAVRPERGGWGGGQTGVDEKG